MEKRIKAAAEIRGDILDTAKQYVLRDRNATHGDPEDNFGRIAQLWAAYKRVDFTPTDVAAMMALMKVARIAQSPDHRDSWIDLAGYAACGAGIALQTPPDVANHPTSAQEEQIGDYHEVVKAFKKL